MVVMVEIRSYKPSMDILVLADMFQHNIEHSTTICNVKNFKIPVYYKYFAILDY